MWGDFSLGLKRSAMVLGVLILALHGYAARGDEPRLSISGYDPVPISPMGNLSRARPNSNICGTDRGGDLPPATTVICL